MEKVWRKTWAGRLFVAFASLILIFAVALGFYLFNLVGQIKKDRLNDEQLSYKNFIGEKEKVALGDGSNYWLGSAAPKITIVEFLDFACPYCKNSFPKIREISLKYKDSVKIIARDYPLHDNSLNLAMAGRCAGEQGLFWPMHDKLFLHQGVSTKEELAELANQIGADAGIFADCFDSKKYLSKIQKDFSDGESLKITGTPTWFVNGYRIEGDMPMETWEDIIQKFK